MIDESAFERLLHGSIDKLRKSGLSILDELLKDQGTGRRDAGYDQDAGGENLHISREFYKAAASKARARGTRTSEVDA